MGKGSGTGGASAGGGGGGAAGGGGLAAAVNSIGLVNSNYLRSGMRDLTFARSIYSGMTPRQADAHARKLAYPVKISIYPDRGRQTVSLNDGRHRMTAAREAGAKYIRATITQYGPRGGVKATWTGPVRIGKPRK